MKEYNKKAEENLLEMKKQKEEADQKMLKLEVVIGYLLKNRTNSRIL